MANCIKSTLNLLEREEICTQASSIYLPELNRHEFRKGFIVKDAELEGWQFYSDENSNVYEIPEFIESRKSAIEFIKAADKWYLAGSRLAVSKQSN